MKVTTQQYLAEPLLYIYDLDFVKVAFMGSSKKHKEKDKDREHKRKRKHRSRSPRERDEKKRRHRDREEYDKDNDRRGDHGHPAPDREEGELAEDAHRPNVPLKQEPQSSSKIFF